MQKKKTAAVAAREAQRQPMPIRQRQRLIDASITALHLYGPSGTTVARVVGIAKLSPGIVRFYFRSKAAMLVASLQYLATEFEDRVVTPVAALRSEPALALQRLVELYLDPDIASPRKVAVWYAFWGEASARQEYLAICGQKDANFAALVHDLIGRMIEASGRRHLDSDAVALGLIGVLEMLWQGFAFQEEADIDRAAARRRCMAYLRSVFPREFAVAGEARGERGARSGESFERNCCFRDAWQFVGLERELAACGEYVALDLAETRALVLRAPDGGLRAFRNACRSQPHALVTGRRGRFADTIACTLHGQAHGLDGRALRPPQGVDLPALDVHSSLGLVFVRSPAAANPRPEPDVVGLADASGFLPVDGAALLSWPVEADWKIVVAQLLESRLPETPNDAWAMRWSAPVLVVNESAGAIRWSAFGEATDGTRGPWRRHYLWPNVLVEQRPGGLSVLQVQPGGHGRSRVQQFEYAAGLAGPEARAGDDEVPRLMRAQLERELAIAASTQQGEADPDYEADRNAPPSPAVAAFRRMLLTAGA